MGADGRQPSGRIRRHGPNLPVVVGLTILVVSGCASEVTSSDENRDRGRIVVRPAANAPVETRSSAGASGTKRHLPAERPARRVTRPRSPSGPRLRVRAVRWTLSTDVTADCRQVNRRTVNCSTEECGETACTTTLHRFRLNGRRLEAHVGSEEPPFRFRTVRAEDAYIALERGGLDDDGLMLIVRFRQLDGGWVPREVVGAVGAVRLRCVGAAQQTPVVEMGRRSFRRSSPASFQGASGRAPREARIEGSLVGSRLRGTYAVTDRLGRRPCSIRRSFDVPTRVPRRYDR